MIIVTTLLFGSALVSFVEGNISLQCIASHLRAHGIYEEVLDSVDSFPGSEAECESFIRIKLDDFNEKVFESMSEDENARQHIGHLKNIFSLLNIIS